MEQLTETITEQKRSRKRNPVLAAFLLGAVAGGMTRNMKAAYDVLEGKYGNGAERRPTLHITYTVKQ